MIEKWFNTNFTTLEPQFWEPWMGSPSIKKEDYKVILKMVLPGINKEDLEFKYEKNVLTVYCNNSSEFVNEFSWSVNIEDYDFKTLKKELTNGVLTLELEKKDDAKPVIFKME